MANGYDKYLEYQFGQTGSFYTALFEAIRQADDGNLDRLAKGFPEEVDAYCVWAHREGIEGLLKRCTPGHPLLKKVESGEAIL